MIKKDKVQRKKGLGHGQDAGRSSAWWPGVPVWEMLYNTAMDTASLPPPLEGNSSL